MRRWEPVVLIAQVVVFFVVGCGTEGADSLPDPRSSTSAATEGPTGSQSSGSKWANFNCGLPSDYNSDSVRYLNRAGENLSEKYRPVGIIRKWVTAYTDERGQPVDWVNIDITALVQHLTEDENGLPIVTYITNAVIDVEPLGCNVSENEATITLAPPPEGGEDVMYFIDREYFPQANRQDASALFLAQVYRVTVSVPDVNESGKPIQPRAVWVGTFQAVPLFDFSVTPFVSAPTLDTEGPNREVVEATVEWDSALAQTAPESYTALRADFSYVSNADQSTYSGSGQPVVIGASGSSARVQYENPANLTMYEPKPDSLTYSISVSRARAVHARTAWPFTLEPGDRQGAVDSIPVDRLKDDNGAITFAYTEKAWVMSTQMLSPQGPYPVVPIVEASEVAD